VSRSERQPARRIVDIKRDGRARYVAMVAKLRAGCRLPRETIDAILIAADRTPDHLVDDLLTSDRAGVAPGDPCERCKGGRLRVYRSIRRGDSVTRYLRCPICGDRPPKNKQTLPASIVPPRRRKNATNPFT